MPFQEPGSGEAAGSHPGAESEAAALEKLLLDLTLQGVNLGSKCLESFGPLPTEGQAVLLRALLSRLKEGLGDQARLSSPPSLQLALALARSRDCNENYSADRPNKD